MNIDETRLMLTVSYLTTLPGYLYIYRCCFERIRFLNLNFDPGDKNFVEQVGLHWLHCARVL